MLKIQIPGREEMTLSHLILDYNGTIAEDGEIIEGIRPRLAELAKELLETGAVFVGDGADVHRQVLTELLGDKEAIANSNILLEQHFELFVGKEQSHNLIKRLIEQKISK